MTPISACVMSFEKPAFSTRRRRAPRRTRRAGTRPARPAESGNRTCHPAAEGGPDTAPRRATRPARSGAERLTAAIARDRCGTRPSVGGAAGPIRRRTSRAATARESAGAPPQIEPPSPRRAL